MHAPVLQGGCFCGAVRYEVSGPTFRATICHCVDCRRAAAAPLVAWFCVRSSAFRILRGVPKSFASSAKGVRSFCPDCGTPLSFVHADYPDEVDITTCSLDTPEAVPPEDHVRIANQVSWIQLADSLPKHSASRVTY
jgi:hypothetical protein